MEEFARSINQIVDNFFITNLWQFRQIVCPVVHSFRIWKILRRTALFFSSSSSLSFLFLQSSQSLITRSISSCFRPVVFKLRALSHLGSSSLRACTCSHSSSARLDVLTIASLWSLGFPLAFALEISWERAISYFILFYGYYSYFHILPVIPTDDERSRTFNSLYKSNFHSKCYYTSA